MKVILCLPDKPPSIEIVNGDFLAFAREIIGPDLDPNTLTPAQSASGRAGVQMWNDDWFLAKELPLNMVATQVYWAHKGRTRYPICGPVIFVGYDYEGDGVDIPEYFIDLLILNGVTLQGWTA